MPTFQNPTTQTIVDFIRGIGIEVRQEPLGETFLPGIRIFAGALLVDEPKLAHPGDLLHEAGHLAVVPAAIRPLLTDNVRETHPDGASGESESIAWSFAAALAAGIDPAVVFHSNGYHGASQGLLFNFQMGVPIGLSPLLAAGMTVFPGSPEGPPPFPHMLEWVRG
ncbi:MAG: hypothetical protein COX57_01640 [Alphaproteobacteria bacterium CG_4_10_14_0_2_um_filter_63_37]|nr:MAG: hypothetical protein AUJ55_12105 [Proteobacteria bacterium CG1_02_64_396]PJA25711.1 MAG: hypothetical protein COX57_01640 [Alphaproteobacteria bacterium CG_4_10_14_0_2_um_filter_63_37]